jgi:hypothetical protein
VTVDYRQECESFGQPFVGTATDAQGLYVKCGCPEGWVRVREYGPTEFVGDAPEGLSPAGGVVCREVASGRQMAFPYLRQATGGGIRPLPKAAMPVWGWIAFGLAGLAAGGAITYLVAKRSKKRRRR